MVLEPLFENSTVESISYEGDEEDVRTMKSKRLNLALSILQREERLFGGELVEMHRALNILSVKGTSQSAQSFLNT